MRTIATMRTTPAIGMTIANSSQSGMPPSLTTPPQPPTETATTSWLGGRLRVGVQVVEELLLTVGVPEMQFDVERRVKLPWPSSVALKRIRVSAREMQPPTSTIELGEARIVPERSEKSPTATTFENEERTSDEELESVNVPGSMRKKWRLSRVYRTIDTKAGIWG